MTPTNSPPAVSNSFNKGAFGELFVDPRDAEQCIKLLKRPITGELAASLHRLVDIAHWARPSDRAHLLSRFAWPVEIFGRADEITGYAMPLAPSSCYFELQIATKVRQTALQLKFLMDADYWAGPAVRSLPPSVSFQDRVEISIDCIDSIDILHQYGLCYGDVSSNNLVGRIDSRPGVFFFDADSISSADQRAVQPLVTPGWDCPSHLDPWEIDRSRIALLVFRLLVTHPGARPEGKGLDLLTASEGHQLAALLNQTYLTGSAEVFASLVHELRILRDAERTRRAMEQAIGSGFARLVLRDRPANLAIDDLHIVEQAQLQVDFEERLDLASGRELKQLLRKARYSGNPFTLDARSLSEQSAPPSTPEQLRELIIDVRFNELANHLAGGLGTLERDSWLERAIQHAHIELDEVPLRTTTQLGAAELSFQWPTDPFVNVAEISMTGAGFTQSEIIQRLPTIGAASMSISAARGATGVASLRLGTRGGTGITIMSPHSTQVALAIPPLPKPPVRSQTRSALQTPIMFDPLKAAAAEAERLRARRKERQRNAALAFSLLLMLSGLGWWFLRDTTVERDRSPLTVVAGTATYQLQFDGKKVTIAWLGLPDDTARLEVSESSDGENWLPLSTTIDRRTGSAIASVHPSAGEPLLLRLQPLNAQGLSTVYRVQASWLDGSGLLTQPQVNTSDPQWSDISWVPVFTGKIPVSFEVRTADGPVPWTVEPTTAKRFLQRPPSSGFLFFAVRSVFADATTGPWIEASAPAPVEPGAP